MASQGEQKNIITLKLSNLQIFCIAVCFVVVILPLLLYFYKYHSFSLSNDREDWNMFGQFIGGTIGPALALLTFSVTVWIAIKFNNYQKVQQENSAKEQLQQTTIDLFKEFRSYNLRRARNLAWEVKKNWEDISKGTYQVDFIKAFIAETEITSGENQTSKEQIKGLYDVFAFYTMLGLYSENETNIRNLNYFYYAWWRKFLYEIATAYDTSKANDISIEPILNDKNNFNKSEFLNNISLQRPLKRLDKICGFEKLTPNFNLYIQKA
jgi:hypothetical protein